MSNIPKYLSMACDAISFFSFDGRSLYIVKGLLMMCVI